MDYIVQEIENTKLFQEISDEELKRILKCSKSTVRNYPAGSYIFEQGGIPSKLFLLLDGQVQICKDFTSESGSLFGIIFSFKALSSPPGLFASGLILQGFHFREWKPLFGIIFSFKVLSSTLGFFA